MIPCTLKQLAWTAWQRGESADLGPERARFEAWWAQIVRAGLGEQAVA